MAHSRTGLIAMILLLTAASLPQDPKTDKEKARQEQKKKEEEAKAALKAYREERAKAKETDDHVRAVESLAQATPHPLIRTELIGILNSSSPDPIRIVAAEALKKYKKDAAACDALIRHAKTRQNEDLRKRCARSFGAIAPFGRSVELQPLFNEESPALAREAVEAVEAIGSVRMLRPLVDLLGELERIREDTGRDPGGPPVPGGAQKGESGNEQRIQRKKELLDPTRTAINTLWTGHALGKALKDATEANAALTASRSQLKKIQEDEDAKDKAP